MLTTVFFSSFMTRDMEVIKPVLRSILTVTIPLVKACGLVSIHIIPNNLLTFFICVTLTEVEALVNDRM